MGVDLMLHERTHIHIDGKVHKIVEVAEHDGARHTHRVHTGCGMTIDVDHEGTKHKAAAEELLALAADAKARREQGLHADYTARAKTSEETAKRHVDDVADQKGRWRTHKKAAATCETCVAVEAGSERFVPEAGFNPPVTVKAGETK
jgi:hypothetical protein